MINKEELRNKAKNIRKNLPIKEISSNIVNRIKNSDLYSVSDNIMLFYPLKNEIDLLELLNDKTKKFYLPRVNQSELEVCPYKRGDNLEKSVQGVMEPLSQAVNKNILNLIFTPALYADKNGYRIGYGGGYYDRFLKDVTAVKVIVIPDVLYIDKLPSDDFDIRCDYIYTEKKKPPVKRLRNLVYYWLLSRLIV